MVGRTRVDRAEPVGNMRGCDARRAPSTEGRVGSIPQLPQNLPQHPQQHRCVPSRDIQPPHQPPDLLFRGRRGHRIDVAAPAQRIQQLRGDLLQFLRRWPGGSAPVGPAQPSDRAPVRRGTAPQPAPGSSTGPSTVGMRISQWQWLRSSFDRPYFSDPKSNADRRRRPVAAGSAAIRTPAGEWDAAVRDVPPKWCPPPAGSPPPRRRRARTLPPPGAAAPRRPPSAPPETPRRTGWTTRSRENPKFAMARAAAPILSGLRVETMTTRRLSFQVLAMISMVTYRPRVAFFPKCPQTHNSGRASYFRNASWKSVGRRVSCKIWVVQHEHTVRASGSRCL